MRHRLFLAIVMLMSATSLFAQYEPTTTWPYLYPDFTDGELQVLQGSPKAGKYNVHLFESTLHFIDGDLIREAAASEIFSVRIGNDYYVNVGGSMMKVLAKSEKGFVAQEAVVDVAQLNNTGGAYGSSSNSISTQALSSLEGIGGTRTNMNHMELKRSRNDGEVLPLNVKLYIVVPGYQIYAAKKDVSELQGLDKKELNAFLKDKQVKWKDPQSLLPLVDYIADRLK